MTNKWILNSPQLALILGAWKECVCVLAGWSSKPATVILGIEVDMVGIPMAWLGTDLLTNCGFWVNSDRGAGTKKPKATG